MNEAEVGAAQPALPAAGDWDGPIFGELGVLAVEPDGGRVQCHACGRWFRFLATHLRHAHNLTADEYRAVFGLAAGRGLVSPVLSERFRGEALRTLRPYYERAAELARSLTFEQRSAAAPRVYTFDELMGLHGQPGSGVHPSGMVGITPLGPRVTVTDNLGNLWTLPGSPPASDQTGAPSNQAGTTEVAGAQTGPASQGRAVPVVDPRQVAVELLHEVPLPNLQVRASPAVGLVAMPAWYWLEGSDGRAIETSRTVELPPLVGPDVPADAVPAVDPRRQGTAFRVDVRVWPARYAWSFGDGGAQVTESPGRRYPEVSDVRHVYEYSSAGFPVRVDVQFAAEFRVNGGPAQPLPPVVRSYEAAYRVQEIQSVLTRP